MCAQWSRGESEWAVAWAMFVCVGCAVAVVCEEVALVRCERASLRTEYRACFVSFSYKTCCSVTKHEGAVWIARPGAIRYP